MEYQGEPIELRHWSPGLGTWIRAAESTYDSVTNTITALIRLADLEGTLIAAAIPEGGCESSEAVLADSGWHMITLPGEFCDSCTWIGGQVCGDLVCALEDDIDPFLAYRYDPELGGYALVPPSENICYQPGMSVWVRTTESDTVIDADVTPSDGPVELSLGNGWNQVGNPYMVAISPSAFSICLGAEEKTLSEAECRMDLYRVVYVRHSSR